LRYYRDYRMPQMPMSSGCSKPIPLVSEAAPPLVSETALPLVSETALPLVSETAFID
jgi:hypothetical protein